MSSRQACGDLDLVRVVEAWPELPSAIRTGILAMIEALIP